MANIGLKSFLYAPMSESQPGKYTAPPARLAGAIESSIDLDISEAELYYDDAKQEHDNQVTGGTITLGVSEADDLIFAPLLGKKIEDVTFTHEDETVEIKKVISGDGDVPVPVGFGYIATNTVKKKKLYRVRFIYSVTFAPFVPSDKTKGAQLEYTTPSVTGNITVLPKIGWEETATLEDEDVAIAYLKSLFVQAEPEA